MTFSTEKNRWRKWLFTGRITQALVAGHEAAHSIVIIMNRNIPVTFISSTVIGRPGREGVTNSTRKSNAYFSVKELKAVLMATMAGKAVEEKLVGESTGHGDDMEDARQTAKELVRRRGHRGTGQKRAVDKAIEEATMAKGNFWRKIGRLSKIHEDVCCAGFAAKNYCVWYLYLFC
ncbi:hypothetical protein niasHT_017526 [Heterodera trifolii]|uniref:Peptidase M41 domain-containing protein n=1 Tax=Heterodera trifolii TaxID=157864 RepID=A0ABD2L5Z2_9BILA